MISRGLCLAGFLNSCEREVLKGDEKIVQVEPATWQRLRLRFSRERVVEVEEKNVLIEYANSRLNTLWQAVVWRVTTLAM